MAHPGFVSIMDVQFLVNVLHERDKIRLIPVQSKLTSLVKKQYETDYGLMKQASLVSVYPRKLTKVYVTKIDKDPGGFYYVTKFDPFHELGDNDMVGMDMLSNLTFVGSNFTVKSGDSYRNMPEDGTEYNSMEPHISNDWHFEINPGFDNE